MEPIPHIFRIGIILMIATLLTNGKEYSPVFPLHRAADVSHTDRLVVHEARSPFTVYDVPQDEELGQESSEVRAPLVLLEDHPRPVYREHVIRPDSENEPEQVPNFKFPPPRSGPNNPSQYQSSIDYDFQTVRPQKEKRPLTSTSTTISEVTDNVSYNKSEESIPVRTESSIVTTVTPTQEESFTTLYKDVDLPTVFEETENKEETQTREVYSKELSDHKQNEEETIQQNYPQLQKLLSTSLNENTPKTRTKTVILDLGPAADGSGYYDPKKKPTTFVLTRAFTDSSIKPTYLYRSAFDGRRAPTNSFTFFQSDVPPKTGQVGYQDYYKPTDQSSENKKSFTTGYEFTVGNNDQNSATSDRSLNYHEYPSNQNQDAPKPDSSYRYNQKSYTQRDSVKLSENVKTSPSVSYNEGTSPADGSPRYFTFYSTRQEYKNTRRPQTTQSTLKDRYPGIYAKEALKPRRELYSETQPQGVSLPDPAPAPAPQTIKNDRVPSAPSIPGNFGYLSNGQPFGSQNVPGRAGADYPTYNEIPLTNFDCLERNIPGFYADMEAGCQVFHTCDMDMRRHSFMCPNGTIFNQEFFTCDWWYNVKCDNSPNFYVLNSDLFKDPPKINEEEKRSKKN